MKLLTEQDLRMNQQAATVAASAVGEPIEAACRCEQASQDMMLEAAGVGAVNRGFVKGAKGLSRVMMPRTMGGMKQMETGGLPSNFVLAASATKVYAIEDKEKGGEQPADVVGERHVAREEHRRDAGCRHPERARHGPVDPVGTPVGEHSGPIGADAQVGLDVANRHRRGDE